MQNKRRKNLFVILAIGSLVIAGIYQHFEKNQDTLKMLQQGEPAVKEFKNLSGDYPSYQLLDEQGNLLGYGAVASASGYGGKLFILSIIDLDGVIKNIVLLDNSETPLYLRKVIDSDYFANFIGHDVELDYSDVDMVTGATITSQAVLNSVRKGTLQIGNDILGRSIQFDPSFTFSWWEGIATVLLVMAVVGASQSVRKLRPWLLTASVLIIGFRLNTPLSSKNLFDLLSGNLPVFIERPFWYVLVLGIPLGTLALGRNFYCSWLCPFGAVQEGLYKSLNLVKFHPSRDVRAFFRKLRWPMLWLAALLSILTKTPSIVGYEPFYVFFDSIGSKAQWLILIIVILMSILQLRFWCNAFCPTGLILDEAANFSRQITSINFQDFRDFSVGSNNGNGKNGSERFTGISNLNNQDRLYALANLAVIVLILVSIIENI